MTVSCNFCGVFNAVKIHIKILLILQSIYVMITTATTSIAKVTLLLPPLEELVPNIGGTGSVEVVS